MIKKFALYLVIPFYILAGISACSFLGEGEPFLIVNVDEDIQFDWREKLGTPYNQDILEITLTSQETFDCDGIEFDHSVIFQEGIIHIAVKGYIIPELCNGISNHAKSTFEVPINDRVNPVNFKIGQNVNISGMIQKLAGKYLISVPPNKGLLIQNETLKTVPSNLLWGIVSSDSLATIPHSWWETDLYDYSSDAKLDAGYYGHFLLDGDGFVVLNNYPIKEYAIPFIFKYNGDRSVIQQKVQSFKDTFGDFSSIFCQASNGEIFN